MGLDVSLRIKTKIFCPHCHLMVASVPKLSNDDESLEFSFNGREYYDFLTQIGYYTKDGKNYGSWKELNPEEIQLLMKVLKENKPWQFNTMITELATLEVGDMVELEADW